VDAADLTDFCGFLRFLSLAFFIFLVFTSQNYLKNVFCGAYCVSLGNLRNTKYAIKLKKRAEKDRF